MSASYVQLSNVSKAFSAGDSSVSVLRGASLSIAEGESVAIVGPSGSGKSTILNLIGTLDRPDSGAITIGGTDVTKLSPAELAKLRNERIGFIFQAHHLLPHCSVLENVLVPTLALADKAPDETVSRAKQLLNQVGLGQRMDYLPGRLSGGERQRAAVVRALINRPSLLLADEPTGALDRKNAAEIGSLLIDLNRGEKLTLLVVTHSRELAGLMSRTLEMSDGLLVPAGGAPEH
jgi:lipoprotein-releasing system ATP-binding protein